MTKYSHSSLCHAMLFCNQNMVVLLIHLALTKYYCCSNETMCWHFDKKAQEQIFEDNPVWFEISGMGVMGRFTRPLPLPAPCEIRIRLCGSGAHSCISAVLFSALCGRNSSSPFPWEKRHLCTHSITLTYKPVSMCMEEGSGTQLFCITLLSNFEPNTSK